jgi:hypothetical protein
VGDGDHRDAVDRQALAGINDLEKTAEKNIRRGMLAYDALQKLQKDPKDAAAKQVLDHNVDALGYALLLKRWIDDPLKATDADIKRAATSTIPNVPVLFWSFRVMVACGFYFIALFALAFWYASRRELDRRRGSCGWRSTACRCRGSPRSSAGSSPSTAASRGRSTACCRRRSASRRSRPRKVATSLPASSCSTRRCWSSTSS